MDDARISRGPSIAMPAWLEKKLDFLGSKTENKEAFFARVSEIFPKSDERYELIEHAYEAAQRAFRDKLRDSGGKYFEHLRAVALILMVHLRVDDADIIAAALLHDVCEDYPLEWNQERVMSEFNKRVGQLVWWVTKPSLGEKYPTKSAVDLKYHRNLSRAPRDAVMIKLADRFHNLITIWHQEDGRAREKILETQNFILPLAERHKLLIHELEDSLRLLEEEKFT